MRENMKEVFVYKILIFALALQVSSAMNSDPNRQIVYEKCRGPGDPGPCKGTYIYKWRFETTTQECTQFIWSGCQGNPQNRFDSEAECLAHCIGGNHTLPPHITTTTPSLKDINLNQTAKEVPEVEQKATPPKNVTIPPPSSSPEPQSEELIFQDSESKKPHKEFMFAQNNTFIQIDGDTIKTFQLRLCREISFQFRTRLPHGLLVYHNVKNPDKIELDPYALYVIVEKGQLKVVHVFGKHSTSVIVGEGLNRDEWHNVTVRIDVHGARLIARVDNQQEEVYLKGLNHDTNYGVSTNLPSVVLVGGLSSEERLHGVKYIIESFVGCIRNIVLKSGKAASDLLPISPLIASKHENVVEGCYNKCESRENLCFVGSRCINHFSSISCDCFGTKYEGEQCDIYSATALTLRGSSFVSYRIYDWKDRTHSSVTRISLMFKTWFDDSVLFYASGESIKPQYIAASLKRNRTYVEMEFGDGPVNFTLGEDLASDYWHNLTIFHDHKTIMVYLDDQMKVFEGAKNLLFDPEIYFGGGPDLNKKKGLASNNNFAGSFKYVFYNDVSILYELKKGNPKVHYIGSLKPEFYEKSVNVIPITYPFATSHIWWPIENVHYLSVKFDFKSSKNTATLAYGDFKTILDDVEGFWEIKLTESNISFELTTEKNVTVLTSIPIEEPTAWHAVDFTYKNGTVTLIVDYRAKETKLYGMSFITQSKLVIGSSIKNASGGLVGCMRDLGINGNDIEPRFVVKTERVVGEIALDNCQFVDPCARPNTCEHGGKCLVKNGRVTCDCTQTGYVGKNCHFTAYRKTCEELALLGYTKTDVYLIDIDGNGKLPPAHVKCEFQHTEDSTKTLTIVEHNLPSQIDVRSTALDDFSFDIKYREFSPEMLQELISHSLYCTQNIRYDCLKAPLDLNSATWFKSSHKNSTTIIDFIGESKRGSCTCKQNKTCVDQNESCNCDSGNNDKWNSDEGTFSDPNSLGITSMYFMQQKNLVEESRGRITLGPLKCVETNTQKYVVTFTTSQSYIEVPGWRKGDIAFSFRTTGEKAILLFQPPIRPNFPSFLVALTGDYELTFAFTLNTGTLRERVINSTRKLNGGEWHKIWIDYNDYHVRFMINTNVDMVDLLPEEQFGPFEGSMFIGGATADLLKKAPVKQGLIGCFRGLVVNGKILDIYSYMSVHLSEIIKDCKPSCVPNPCKNGAQCKELWSNFKCECKNPWAHVGEYCEINHNDKALTFTNSQSYLKKIYVNNSDGEFLRAILKENFLVNIRTYDDRALILYAHDNSNNFVHLHISNADEVIYLYNYGNEIVNLTVKSAGLNNGKSIQIAVMKTETSTTLHVNDLNVTHDKGNLLLTEYSNKPWTNPQLEVISPHRPPAPTISYFQFNIGGYDQTNLLRVNNNTLDGLVGCVRGLRIGTTTIDLAELAKTNEADHTDGVLNECQMICDTEPCKNGGICFENFAKSAEKPLCNCEGTSFTGEFCTEDRGGEFSGEAGLERKFVFNGTIDQIKLQMAFSTADVRGMPRMMLLIQTESSKQYLRIALNPEGEIEFHEEREHVIYTHTAKRSTPEDNFANGNRHSILYKRTLDDAALFIDRTMVNLTKMTKHPEPEQSVPIPGITNRLLIGISNSTLDPRFSIYKSYSGCISNLFLVINNETMDPVDEYMMFKKDGSEHTKTLNPSGVRSTQCNVQFDIIRKLIDEPLLNISLGTDKNWVEESPTRKPYKLDYVDNGEKEEQTQFVFIILITIFVVIIICCIIEVYRTDRAHKKRVERETDESIIWAKEQATKMHESSSARLSFKSIASDHDNEAKIKVINEPTPPLVGILKNGSAKPNVEYDKPNKEHPVIRGKLINLILRHGCLRYFWDIHQIFIYSAIHASILPLHPNEKYFIKSAQPFSDS
ncbi:hypothetical protein ACKWTF_013185 [Chironomus riparius]